MMRVSYVVLTYNRKEELKTCLDSIVKQTYPEIEIIVVDNNSQDGTEKIMQHYPHVNYHRLKTNTGACQGRNICFGLAEGDVVVVLDDDSELPSPDTTSDIVAGFKTRPEMGVMALKVVNPIQPLTRRTIPSRKKSIANRTTEVEVAYFLEGGVAFRNQVLQEVGHYPPEYFYAMEALDFSYRLAKTSWKIYYYPQIHVLHHESVAQRPGWRRFYYDIRNRIWLTTTFLPIGYQVINLCFWGVKMGLQSLLHGHFKSFARGVRDGFRGRAPFRDRRQKMLLTSVEIRRIRKLGGRVCY